MKIIEASSAAQTMDTIVEAPQVRASPEVVQVAAVEPTKAIRVGRHVLILGRGEFAMSCWQILRQAPRMAGRIIGFVDHVEGGQGDPLVVGSLTELPALVEQYKVGMIVVCLDDRRATLPMERLLELKVMGIDVMDGHRLVEEVTGRISIDSIRPSMLVFSDGFKRRAAAGVLKHILDIVCASLCLLVTAPLFLIVAVLIKLDSPGPVFYRQSRVGLGSHPFMMIKFRSMVSDAELSGPRWAEKNDDRVSRVGRWLRKLRIDEIPQCINVLKGEMSFIGPRPERPVFVEELRKVIPYYDIRHTVKPGITGWAQVMSGYADSHQASRLKVQYDLYYIKNQSFWLDMKTLFKTFRVVVTGNGAR